MTLETVTFTNQSSALATGTTSCTLAAARLVGAPPAFLHVLTGYKSFPFVCFQCVHLQSFASPRDF